MKRITILLASMALVASGLHILPAAAAEEAPSIPEVVQIEDPVNDANYLNDQAVGNGVDQDDHVTPADVGSFSDIMKVWFTNDAETATAHFQVQGFPGANRASIYYIVYATPGEGSAASSTLGCLRFVGILSGATYAQSADEAKIFDHCNEGSSYFTNGAEAKFSMVEGPDGTGIVSITAPRAYSELLNAATLTAPYAETRNITGEATQVGFFSGPRIDTTKVGTDFVMVTGGAKEKTPPGKNDPPGKKKGCAKGKGKKRGCEGKGKKAPKPGKPSAQCAPFTPGEAGKDAKTIVLTDAAAEDKPVEEALSFGEAIPFRSTSSNFVNIQVDSAAKEAGLYAYIDFMPRNDYDLNLLHPDGSYAAQSHGFNPLIEINDIPLPVIGPFSSTGHGGESTDHSEKLVGIKTADCGGWTLDVTNFAGPGGDVTLQLWLGEAKTDPSEEGSVT